MADLPFEGLKVIDMTWSGAGVFILNFLSHYGATVVRVESARQPDPIRRVYTYTDATGNSPNALNRSALFAFSHPAKKYSLTLDLKNPQAVAVYRRLIAWADVLGECFPTGVMERFGFGYDEVRKIKPDIIMVRSCGYGHTGPLAKQAGFGMTLAAYAMMYSIAGWPDRSPVPVSSYYSDQLSPLPCMLAMVAALDYRRRTGKGQCIDQSQIESSLNYLAPLVLDYAANGRQLSLTGNKCAYAAPHGIYRCKGEEKWVAIEVYTDAEWTSFCKVIGSPAWTRDTRFETLTGRLENSDALDKLVETWTVKYTPEKVMALLQRASVGAGVVADARDIVEDAQLEHYRFFREVEHPYVGKVKFAHPPAFKLSGVDAEVWRSSILGEHNEYVCKEILGYSDEAYQNLIRDKVFD
ncbi:MAG: CoA transferase [Dehalococcoidales bacterium]|jgi:benzylsuccinate CoA-transferase BbsF subunit